MKEGYITKKNSFLFSNVSMSRQCALVYKKTGRQEGLNCFPSTLESGTGINVRVRLSIFEKRIKKKKH